MGYISRPLFPHTSASHMRLLHSHVSLTHFHVSNSLVSTLLSFEHSSTHFLREKAQTIWGYLSFSANPATLQLLTICYPDATTYVKKKADFNA